MKLEEDDQEEELERGVLHEEIEEEDEELEEEKLNEEEEDEDEEFEEIEEDEDLEDVDEPVTICALIDVQQSAQNLTIRVVRAAFPLRCCCGCRT